MSNKALYRWHNRIGQVAFVAIIAWALSGISHPVMSRINPRPVVMHPPVSSSAIATLTSFSAALSNNGIETFEQAQFLNVDGNSFYRIEHGNNIAYIDARSGQQAELNDNEYAKKLARYYLDDDFNKVTSVERVTAFDDEYLFINRLLPVYKVTFDRPDNMRVYVEISTGRLATLVDDRKALVGWLFRQLHSWVFIENPWLRTIAMSVLLLAGMVLSLVGLLMAWRGRAKDAGEHQRQMSRANVWHRRLGIGFGVLMLTFSFSGIYHLLNKPVVAQPIKPAPVTSFNPQDLVLDWSAIARAVDEEYFQWGSLVVVEGIPFLRLVLAAPKIKRGQVVEGLPGKKNKQHSVVKPGRAEHHSSKSVAASRGVVYINALSSQVCGNCERRHVLALAGYYLGTVSDGSWRVEEIRRFSSDYGFINKRLPVHVVHIEGRLAGRDEREGDDSVGSGSNRAVFVETSTGALASIASDSSRLESWSFSYLHKWQFFDSFSKNLRDVLLVATMLVIAITCLLGIVISLKPKGKLQR